jgi:hypothetical protein
MSTFDNLDKNSGDQNSSRGWSSSVLHLPSDSSNCKLGKSCAPDSVSIKSDKKESTEKI